MENRNKPAFACTDGKTFAHDGLTKREYFSAMAMQGYIVERSAQDDIDRQKLAKWSVKMADELLKALESK